LLEYVDRKEDPLIQTARTHQHNINSAALQTAKCLKKELQKGTRQIKNRREREGGRERERERERREGERKRGGKMMGREEDAWTIATQLKTKN